MEFKPHSVDLSMVPGDQIKITVGIMHKCDISVKPNGELRIYYKGGKSQEL